MSSKVLAARFSGRCFSLSAHCASPALNVASLVLPSAKVNFDCPSVRKTAHPGFSVFAGEPLSPEDAGQLERLARYVTRPPLAADSIRRT
ncbi:MAG: hypothetical protein DMG09_24045, partial [Acidobacteria bacterium]